MSLIHSLSVIGLTLGWSRQTVKIKNIALDKVDIIMSIRWSWSEYSNDILSQLLICRNFTKIFEQVNLTRLKQITKIAFGPSFF